MPKVHNGDQTTGSSRRAQRGPRVSSSLSEINVVPLVDVMLVLLIIFMVAAPMLQRGVEVNLPQARRAQPISDERLFISVPLSYRENRRVQFGDEAIGLDVLPERVRQAMRTQEQKEVFLRGDGGITLQELMDVMDSLKEGGVERVGLVARLPTDR